MWLTYDAAYILGYLPNWTELSIYLYIDHACCWQTCLHFVVVYQVRVLLGLESDRCPSPVRTRSMAVVKPEKKKDQEEVEVSDNLSTIHTSLREAIGDYCTKRDLSHIFLHTIMERQSVSSLPLSMLTCVFLSQQIYIKNKSTCLEKMLSWWFKSRPMLSFQTVMWPVGDILLERSVDTNTRVFCRVSTSIYIIIAIYKN